MSDVKNSGFLEYKFECSRLENDTEAGDETIGLYCQYSTAFLTKEDVIAMARHFNLQGESIDPCESKNIVGN